MWYNLMWYAFGALISRLQEWQIKLRQKKNKPARKTLRPNEYYNSKTRGMNTTIRIVLGKERFISSYRLEMTDQLPKGKKSTKSLREKEAEINAYLENSIDIDGHETLLC